MAANGNSWIKSLFTAGALIRLAIAIGVAVAIWIGISAWIGDRTQITIDQFTSKPVDLLSPQWLHLIAVIPAFYVLRVLSLTDGPYCGPPDRGGSAINATSP